MKNKNVGPMLTTSVRCFECVLNKRFVVCIRIFLKLVILHVKTQIAKIKIVCSNCYILSSNKFGGFFLVYDVFDVGII